VGAPLGLMGVGLMGGEQLCGGMIST